MLNISFSSSHTHAFLRPALLAHYRHYCRSRALYASVLLSCMSIWNYSAYCKPAKKILLLKYIRTLTPHIDSRAVTLLSMLHRYYILYRGCGLSSWAELFCMYSNDLWCIMIITTNKAALTNLPLNLQATWAVLAVIARRCRRCRRDLFWLTESLSTLGSSTCEPVFGLVTHSGWVSFWKRSSDSPSSVTQGRFCLQSPNSSSDNLLCCYGNFWVLARYCGFLWNAVVAGMGDPPF